MLTERVKVPLDRAEAGEYNVLSLEAGRAVILKLSNMGIYPGARIEVLAPATARGGSGLRPSGRRQHSRRPFGGGPARHGSVRIAVKGVQFGIGHGMASKIFVQRAGAEASFDRGRKGAGEGTRLRGAKLNSERLQEAKLEGARLKGAKLEGERLPTLRDYKQGQKGRILVVRGEGKFKKRLLEMGFVRGAEIYVEKYAPLMDPVEYIIKGYHVSLRRDEAEKIIMSEPE